MLKQFIQLPKKMMSTSAQQSKSSVLHNLKFLNLAVNQLPVEENPGNQTHKVRGHFYSKVKPQARKNPRIACLSESALQLLDLNKSSVLATEIESAQILAGNTTPSNAVPVAHCYCGHQFGSWAAQLGDGRAISLGDIRNSNDQVIELQLKGSGLTPYSRTADGNAVLRSSVREFLCSEAMHALRIPTTRAASLIVSEDTAMRDPLYDHHVVNEPCAIVLRLAGSFIRFGSFQVCDKGGPSEGLGEQMIPELLDFVIKHHYPHLNSAHEKYAAFLEELTQRTAQLVAHWQTVGFCHGVLNTDNMSIVGVTIDYGPFGWMEHFDRKHICNHSDKEGYYAYENQPKVCKWNLMRLAESMGFAMDVEVAKKIVEEKYDGFYQAHYMKLMREKLGLLGEDNGDKMIVRRLFDFMDEAGTEFTAFFRRLAEFRADEGSENAQLVELLMKLSASRDEIIEKKRPMFNEVMIYQLKKLQTANPMILAMRGISESFIEEQEQKLEEFSEFEAITEEERVDKIQTALKAWLSTYRTRLNSQNEKQTDSERKKAMNAVNPAVVLTNSMAQDAIDLAEKGDYSGVEKCLRILTNPFEQPAEEQMGSCAIGGDKKSRKICVSCSS